MPERELFYRGLFRALMRVQLLMLALFLLVMVVLYSAWQQSFEQETISRLQKQQQKQLLALQEELKNIPEYFQLINKMWQEALTEDVLQTLPYLLQVERSQALQEVQINTNGTAYRFVYQENVWQNYVAPEALLLPFGLKADLLLAASAWQQNQGWLVRDKSLYYVYQGEDALIYARYDLPVLLKQDFFIDENSRLQISNYLLDNPTSSNACQVKNPLFMQQALLTLGLKEIDFTNEKVKSYWFPARAAQPCAASLTIMPLPLAKAETIELSAAALATAPLLWLWQDLPNGSANAVYYIQGLMFLVLLVALLGMVFTARVLQKYFVLPMQNMLKKIAQIQKTLPQSHNDLKAAQPQQMRDVFERIDQAFHDLSQTVADIHNISAHQEKKNFSLSDFYSENQQLQLRWLQSEKMSALGQMVAGLAHEMNTPLGYIGSNVTFLQGAINEVRWLQEILQQLLSQLEQEQPEYYAHWQAGFEINEFHEEALQGSFIEEMEQVLDDILYGIDQLFSIVEGLKVYSRKESVVNVPLNLSQTVAGALKIAKAAVGKHSLTADLPEDLPLILGSPNEITQICINLVTNAAQAIVHDHGKIHVRVFRSAGMLGLSVSDNGCGVPKALREKIFEPFFTTKPIGEGTGLGLAITQQLLLKYGGRLILDSEEGIGSTFTACFPLQNSPEVSENHQQKYKE
jgi:signal transduction histidine kinase